MAVATGMLGALMFFGAGGTFGPIGRRRRAPVVRMLLATSRPDEPPTATSSGGLDAAALDALAETRDP